MFKASAIDLWQRYRNAIEMSGHLGRLGILFKLWGIELHPKLECRCNPLNVTVILFRNRIFFYVSFSSVCWGHIIWSQIASRTQIIMIERNQILKKLYSHSIFFPNCFSAIWISPLAAAGSHAFPLLCLLEPLLLPSSSRRFIRLNSNGNDVDKAKFTLKKIRFDSKRFSSTSTLKIGLVLYNLSQQILVSIIFFLSKLHFHIFSTRGLIACQTTLSSHLREYKIELLLSGVKQLSLDTSLFSTGPLQVTIQQLTAFTAQGTVAALGLTSEEVWDQVKRWF